MAFRCIETHSECRGAIVAIGLQAYRKCVRFHRCQALNESVLSTLRPKDSTLHQDPRYFRSRVAQDSGAERPMRSAATILTRTDRGGETLSTCRLGSAYGAAYSFESVVSGPLNTVGLAAAQGIPQPRVRFRQQSRFRVPARISNGRYCAEHHKRRRSQFGSLSPFGADC